MPKMLAGLYLVGNEKILTLWGTIFCVVCIRSVDVHPNYLPSWANRQPLLLSTLGGKKMEQAHFKQ